MQRFKVIAALLMLLLMTPLPRACAAMSRGATAQQGCCEKHQAERCCDGVSAVCGAAQASVATMAYPARSFSLVVPAAVVVAVDVARVECVDARCVALRAPVRHWPPGLVIAATIVLQI